MDAFVALLIRILEGLFVVGVAGSAVVWVLTTFEDIENMFARDESPGGVDVSESEAPPKA